MLRAYRLVYPDSPHAPPKLWEWEQPYVDNLIVNARTFGRRVVQRYFRDWDALAHANARIWDTYYRPRPLYDHLATWEEWLAEYRQLVVEVQDIYEEQKVFGTVGKHA